jgi:hypothetical protein
MEKPTDDPASETVCGDPEALSTIVTEASRLPVAVGVKVTLMAQDTPTERLPAHVVVWPKSPALVPVMPRLLINSAALPEFVSVTVSGALVVPVAVDPNVTLDGVSVTSGNVPASGVAISD